ncbi:MAG: hypothetical protein AAF799_22585 [Myxococcota bacterium]
MGQCLGIDIFNTERAQAEEAGPPAGPQPPVVEISLEDVNTIDERSPTVYYVIVGRGPMAVVDYATLQGSPWGRNRIGGRTVLFVGFPNPWPRYLRHGLGQPNYLLSLPGFQAANQPSRAGPNLTIDGGLDSQHFGGCVDAEFNTFNNVEVAQEWVALIESRNAPGVVDAGIQNEVEGQDVHNAVAARLADPWPNFDPEEEANYRLCLYHPITEVARWVYAAGIDLVTGPGRPHVYPPAGGHSPETLNAKTPPWLTPEHWITIRRWRERRTLNGVDAIRDEVQWNARERICVTAGGGVGLNAAEKSRVNNCFLDWFGRDQLMPIFENPRNITYLKDPNTNQRCAYGSRFAVGINLEDDLLAGTTPHRMGRGAALQTVARHTPNIVDVRLYHYQPQNGPCHIRDWWNSRDPLDAQGYWTFSPQYRALLVGPTEELLPRYNRLVIPNGQGTQHVGQPYAIARQLQFQPVVRQGRMVAMETADHVVRILGAACNDFPGNAWATWNNAGRPNVTAADVMWHYHATLPVSAVPDGFIICGANTAIANHYFSPANLNTNVNTMTLAELGALLGNAAVALQIVQNRNARNGYANLGDIQQATGLNLPSFAQLTYEY